MCWKNGQRSPIHDHAASNSAVRVLRGPATETAFEYAANGLIKVVGSPGLPAAFVLVSRQSSIDG
jgi:cysteine dioxygenase